ncbi:MAG TPA: hypothetical protein VGK64_05055 [Bryobacteraceae bacterium]
MGTKISLLLFSLLAPVCAQPPLSADSARQVQRLLEEAPKGEKLDCQIRTQRPFLDFAFRFESGYIVACPAKIFDGAASRLGSFVRITPENGKPMFLGEAFAVPAVPAETRKFNDIRKVKSYLFISGVFALGEGKYSVAVLVGDNRGRYVRKEWSVRAERSRAERSVAVTLPAGTITPMAPKPWKGERGDSPSVARLTIVLDAAPMNPYSLRLRAWDRALLLDSLSSVLTHTRSHSVRVVAMNMDQQREIFRDDDFNAEDWSRLATRLRDLELGTISYRVLGRQRGWSDLLLNILTREMDSAEPSDAVVFLGPTARITEKIPAELLPRRTAPKPEFFYIEYYPFWLRGREYPDALAHVTHALGGQILKIHSPGELAAALKKIGEQLAGAN